MALWPIPGRSTGPQAPEERHTDGGRPVRRSAAAHEAARRVPPRAGEGRFPEASSLWEQVIPALPASSRRDIGVYHARHAQALAGCGEPEQAVAVARLAAPVAAQSGSARMRAELHALRQRMEPWRGGQPWRDLDDTLRALPSAGKAS